MSKPLLTAAFALVLSASAPLSLVWADVTEEEHVPPNVPVQEDEGAAVPEDEDIDALDRTLLYGTEEDEGYDEADIDEAQDLEELRESESWKGPVDGVAPATREDLSPIVPRAADEVISPRFEALEAALGRRVAAWQERIEALGARAVAEDDAELGDVVEDIEGDFIVLVNQWRLLQQTTDPDQWETESTRFRAALDRFENEWQNKIDIDAEGM